MDPVQQQHPPIPKNHVHQAKNAHNADKNPTPTHPPHNLPESRTRHTTQHHVLTTHNPNHPNNNNIKLLLKKQQHQHHKHLHQREQNTHNNQQHQRDKIILTFKNNLNHKYTTLTIINNNKYLLNTKTIHKFIFNIRTTITATPSPQTTCNTIQPRFTELLTNPSWLPEHYQKNYPKNNINNKIGQ